jgi:ornithine cyclodeaminase/alanine dehydrogenase-like protein (mu-crystallin family)
MLKSSEVEDLLDLPGTIAVLEQVSHEQAAGGVVPWPPSLMRSDGALLILRSGGLPARHRMGARITTGPHNPSFVAIHESPSGRLIGFMAYPFSEMRLAASSALGTDRMARPDARTVAMIGTGRNALGILEAVASVRQLESVRAYSRNAENRQQFATSATQHLGIPVRAVDEAQQAVEGADIVLVATSSTTPAVLGEWLAPEAHVTAIGIRNELDEEVFARASLIVTSSKVQEMNIHDIRDDWPMVRLMRAGRLKLEDVYELGDVVAGRVGRTSGITVFRDAQGGFGDIALAAWSFERAVELGRGIDVEME